MESLKIKDQITSYNLPRRGMEQKLLLLKALEGRKKPFGMKKVLVIEQDEIIPTKLCLMLLSCGYEPDPGESRAAFDLYRKAFESGDGYYSVIIDINLANAFKTVRKLLKFDPDAKIIACGSDFNQTGPELKKNVFRGMLPKPYRIDQLREALS